MSERFYVATTSGYNLTNVSSRSREGVTAMVLDRANLHRVVTLHRSEDPGPYSGGRLGRGGAIRLAEDEAARLNAA